MPILLSPALVRKLRLSANDAMWLAWNAAHPTGGSVDEVKCIKNLVHNALPGVDAAWRGLLGGVGINANLTGVVCHGRPYVRYSGAPNDCELGDLMLVHDHRPSPGVLERRAAVIQAKVFGKDGVTSKNPVQLGLYQAWPPFTYTSWPGKFADLKTMLATHADITASTPDPLRRDVFVSKPHPPRATADTVDTGARYGMIDTALSHWSRPWLSRNPWRLSSPNVGNLYKHKGGMSLGGYLVKMVMGKAGRKVPSPGWPAGLSGACHWSLVVEELLSLLPPPPPIPAASTSAGAAAGSGGALAFLSTPASSRSTTGGPPSSDGSSADDREGAFAVIRITTSGGPEARG